MERRAGKGVLVLAVLLAWLARVAWYARSGREEVSFYVLRQERSQGRAQTSFGLSYGFRF